MFVFHGCKDCLYLCLPQEEMCNLPLTIVLSGGNFVQNNSFIVREIYAIRCLLICYELFFFHGIFNRVKCTFIIFVLHPGIA